MNNASNTTEGTPTAADAVVEILPNLGDPFYNLRIEEVIWKQRIQDVGCTKDALPAPTCQRSKIPLIGPKGHEKYYYQLTAI